MCKLYIETSDLDKVISAVDSEEFMKLAGPAVLELHSEKLDEFAVERSFAASFTPPSIHTKFSIVTGIVIGLKLAESQLSLKLGADNSTTINEYAEYSVVDDLVSAHDLTGSPQVA